MSFNLLRIRIESIMTQDDSAAAGPLTSLLWLVSRGYAAGVRLRNRLYDCQVRPSQRLPVKVISVGNLGVGGTGKTPFTLYLANMLHQIGQRVVIITRGYGGQVGKPSLVVSDGQQLLVSSRIAGDEAVLMARRLPQIPIVIGKKRVWAGQLAQARFAPDVLVCDDAFQHRSLARDLDLVLMDAARPLGNGHLLPRGILREPPTGLQRAQALILTRCQQPVLPRSLHQWARHKPVFYARHVPEIREMIPQGQLTSVQVAAPLSGWGQEPFFAFAGLANNAAFFQALRDWGWKLSGTVGFSDHYPYKLPELQALEQIALRSGATRLVTTHKDYVRFEGRFRWSLDLMIIDVRMGFNPENEAALRRFVRAVLFKKGG